MLLEVTDNLKSITERHAPYQGILYQKDRRYWYEIYDKSAASITRENKSKKTSRQWE